MKKKINRKRAVLYPYDIENYQLVRFNDLLKEIEIINVDVSGRKYLLNKDFSYLYMGEKTGKLIEDIDKTEYDVLIVGNGQLLHNEMIVYDKVEQAAKAGKEIIVLYLLSEEQKRLLIEICQKYSALLKFYEGKNVKTDKIEIDNQKLYQINIPVVLIVGVTERTKKMDVLLATKDYFENRGYVVSAIGSKKYCELFGIHSFPQFMFDSINEDKKILYFNALCKNIEYYEKPDILIIGVPGSLVPYNDTFTNHFGITAFQVGQAICPDVVILNISYGEYDQTFLNNISQMSKCRVGEEVTCYVMSNSHVDINSSKEEGKMQYFNVGIQEIDERIKQINTNNKQSIFNGLRNSDLYLVGEFIEKSLEANSACI